MIFKKKNFVKILILSPCYLNYYLLTKDWKKSLVCKINYSKINLFSNFEKFAGFARKQVTIETRPHWKSLDDQNEQESLYLEVSVKKTAFQLLLENIENEYCTYI